MAIAREDGRLPDGDFVDFGWARHTRARMAMETETETVSQRMLETSIDWVAIICRAVLYRKRRNLSTDGREDERRRKVSSAESKKVVEGGRTAEGDDETEEDEDSIDIPSLHTLSSLVLLLSGASSSAKFQTTRPLSDSQGAQGQSTAPDSHPLIGLRPGFWEGEWYVPGLC